MIFGITLFGFDWNKDWILIELFAMNVELEHWAGSEHRALFYLGTENGRVKFLDIFFIPIINRPSV